MRKGSHDRFAQFKFVGCQVRKPTSPYSKITKKCIFIPSKSQANLSLSAPKILFLFFLFSC